MNNINFSNLNDNLQRLVHRYLWDPEPRNIDPMKPIWLLGREYRSIPPLPPTTNSDIVEVEPSHYEEPPATSEWPKPFLEDFGSRTWITYRSDFPPIPKSSPNATLNLFNTFRSHLPEHSHGFTSDAGWGCMIRSAQCVLANTLSNLHLSRDWRRGQRETEERNLLSLFADDPRAPFSIHKFVAHGQEACGVHPGEWFGPSAAARCIQALASSHKPSGLRVYITGDGGDVWEDSFLRTALGPDGVFKPTLILVAIRLGIKGVTPVYWEALKATLQMPQSVGIAGGRPSSSHYFIGTQGDRFFYMDPHVCRTRFPLRKAEDYQEDEIESCYTTRLRMLDIRDMDPSMLLAYLVRNEKDWEAWKRGVQEVQGKSVVQVGAKEPEGGKDGGGGGREGAVEEVEVLTDEDYEEDGGLA